MGFKVFSFLVGTAGGGSIKGLRGYEVFLALFCVAERLAPLGRKRGISRAGPPDPPAIKIAGPSAPASLGLPEGAMALPGFIHAASLWVRARS